MADSYTNNLNLTKPEVGASADSWGAKLNSSLDGVDSVFNASGNGTSVGLNVGSGKTLNVSGSVSGGVLATVNGTETLTGKTISGASNTLSNIPLAAAVTGTLSTANGGTGVTSVPAAGQLLIGNGSGYSLANLTAGANVTITNTPGGISIAATGTSTGGTTTGGTITGVSGSSSVSGLTLSGGGTTGAVTLTLSGTPTIQASALQGSSLAASVTTSSLTTVGTLSSLNVSGVTTHSGNTTIQSGAALFLQTSNSAPGYANSTIGGAWTTDASNGPGMFISRANYVNLVLNNNSGGSVVEFYKSGAGVGSIQVTSSSTSYGTSSDYRLKQNLEPLTGALTRLQNLSVYRFNWKADPNGPKVDGFVAHEVTPVVPEAITGAKDAVTADGKIKAQNIDQSKLVPLLTAALQEANAKIDALTARVAALEAA